ncbi:MAG: GNAT family N-acetyltransferase [Pseudomonadota bacterium]
MNAPAKLNNIRRQLDSFVFSYSPAVLAGVVALVAAVLLAGQNAVFAEAMPFTLLPALDGATAVAGALALATLALGLSRRVRFAYLTVFLIGAAKFILAVKAGGSVAQIGHYALLLAILAAARPAFFRPSAFVGLSSDRRRSLALLTAVASVGIVMLAASDGPLDYAAGVILLAAFATFVAAPARLAINPPTPTDLAGAERALSDALAPRPESMLAFSGDKALLFSSTGASFIQYGSSADTLIAMGGPIGDPTEKQALLKDFKALAAKRGATPAIYAAAPEDVPDLISTGFFVEKIGENATLDLSLFSLSGRKREVIRRGSRKLRERAGATFSIHQPPHNDAFIASLRPISDAWLNAHNGREKMFSLGAFERKILDRCPVGVVHLNGRAVAFGSLLTTPDKSWAAIDLMRYDPEAQITNTMDFLFVELILWAKAEGFARFDLSMAPLSGLDPKTTVFARAMHTIFERGERLYNFKGLRRFKSKFGPEWEPRFIAGVGPVATAVAAARAAALTNGGALVLPSLRAAQPIKQVSRKSADQSNNGAPN